MDKRQRWTTLLEVLGERNQISVHEAAEHLGVSQATIRRDFDELASQQLLRRTRGGAVANGVAYDLPLRYKAGRHADEKLRIALAAAELVPPGAVVGLNGGTTTTEVARALASRPDLEGDDGGPGLTLVTNAVNIAAEMTVRPNLKVVMTGGVCRHQSYELVGPLTTGVLEQLSLDIAYLGVNALDDLTGASANNESEAATNRLMASRAARGVVVADASKLGRRAFSRICAPAEIDRLITDRSATEAQIGVLEEAGIPVTVV
jgi:DeoR family transcriptional regulator, aga operon transcriptional repressor